jgi:2-succinyl-6-hydroxy-2,4-cyclohexadiene-1-carboxylate synthase
MVRTIDILGVPHAYDLTPQTGSSDILVFIHGWLLSREYWQPVIDLLSPQYQCLSYDLRGFGGSQPQRDRSLVNPTSLAQSSRGGAVLMATAPTVALELSPYRPAAYAQDLATLLQKLEISNAWLVGHSLGGSIALWAADQCPERIKGVICVNSGGGIYLKEEFERFRAAGQQLVKLRPRWLCHVPLVDMLMTRMNVATPLERRWGRQRLQDLVTAHPEAALGTLLDSTTEAEVHCLPQVIARLKQPVHFIAGANDSIMEPQYVRHLASFHHSFQPCGNNVSEIADCGHMSMVEQPNAVAEQIWAIIMHYQ